ncbi:phosphopantetheine-binding protein [Massilia aurea]|uniref:acyl carrier protein n=1 Tax=Massilia aurea TaxID=373040 RepID=UPI0034633417
MVAIEAASGLDAASVMVSWLPPFHDMGLVGSIVAPAAVGFRSALIAWRAPEQGDCPPDAPGVGLLLAHDTRMLVRRCLLYGLQDAGLETLDDDQAFADAGLDSLSAMPVTLEFERQPGLTINSALLHEYQTVATLAAYLDARRVGAAAAAGAAPG